MEQNFLQPTQFKLVIGDKSIGTRRIEFYLQSLSVPGLTIGEVRVPHRKDVGYLPGEQLEHTTLEAQVICDENLLAHKELIDWIKLNQNVNEPQVRDMELLIMSSHNNPVASYVFKNAWPTNVGNFELNVAAADNTIITIPATFRFDYFDVAQV